MIERPKREIIHKTTNVMLGLLLLSAIYVPKQAQADFPSDSCATTEITLPDNSGYLVGQDFETEIESGWSTHAPCPYSAMVFVTGPAIPQAMIFRNAPADFDASCGMSDIGGNKTVTCISGPLAANETIGEIELQIRAPVPGEGTLQLYDTQAMATKLSNYTAFELAALQNHNYLPVAVSETVVASHEGVEEHDIVVPIESTRK